jgi:hypothetical protein
MPETPSQFIESLTPRHREQNPVLYPNLKLQLWKSGIRQNRLAQLVGMHETVLSRIINGFRPPDSEIRSRIAAALQSDEAWLFAADVDSRPVPKAEQER